ncbi:MAG: hypothetical protein ACKPKO_10035, partial [Candidatus Fonsibacter sp.]
MLKPKMTSYKNIEYRYIYTVCQACYKLLKALRTNTSTTLPEPTKIRSRTSYRYTGTTGTSPETM